MVAVAPTQIAGIDGVTELTKNGKNNLNNENNNPDADGKMVSSALLMQKIQGLNSYFCRMIDTIPARIYFAKNEEILQEMENTKHSLISQSELSHKSFNKRARLNPTAQKKVSDIATEFYSKKKVSSKMNELKKKLSKRIKELKGGRGAEEKTMKRSLNGDSKTDQNNNQKRKKTNNYEEAAEDFGGLDVDSKMKEGKFAFSKFDFATQTDIAAEKALEKMKEKKTGLKGLLAKAQKTEKKIDRLEQSGQGDAAQRMKMEKLWNNALDRAEGNKVRDDPKLLGKQLKQKEKQKKKSSEKWDERKKAIDSHREKRQDKRTKNLEARKQVKKDKKIKILKKRGRILD